MKFTGKLGIMLCIRHAVRENDMKMCKRIWGVMLLAMLCLSGCGEAKLPEVIDRPTVIVSNDGSVTAYLVEDFDKAYYDTEELKEMALQEAEEYNNSKVQSLEDGIPVIVKDVGLVAGNDKLVFVAYDFNTFDVYQHFLGQKLFSGTVMEAQMKNYKFDVSLQNVKDGSELSGATLFEDKDKKIIVTDAKAVIYCPGKVTHLSKGAIYNEDGSVDTTAVEGLVYIILK